eukprot:gnl/MRDRNA2_/MRDRNA2_23206_c0_seq1.p1 gnl/MRDRNA2_/MRDRNA2_23206_c0~~gnl/MRDRNA2_/MRDRNA2_23206_c0_seq1.p1  ORF type:complete len:438 (+),score=34.31 gnl/MRDRNA2_/MRDRNA2_23206_c0_seq1:99-1316(+)
MAERRTQPMPDDLVLLGDVFELILDPLNQTHRHPRELFADTNTFGFDVPKFRRLVENISYQMEVSFILGNHDEDIDEQLLQEAFGPCVKHMGYGFKKYGIWFEHGQNPDPCCGIEREEGKKQVLPFGYFFTRSSLEGFVGQMCQGPHAVHRTEEISYWQQFKDIMSFIMFYAMNLVTPDSMRVEFLTSPENFGNLTAFAFKALVGHMHTPGEEILKEYIVNGADRNSLYFGVNTSNYTLLDVVYDHRDLFQKMAKKCPYDLVRARARIYEQKGDYTLWAERDTQHDVVVVGHTHIPDMQERWRTRPGWKKGRQPGEVREKVAYVNSGGWAPGSGGVISKTYVDFDIKDVTDTGNWRATYVRVIQYPEVEMYAMDLSRSYLPCASYMCINAIIIYHFLFALQVVAF